MRRIILYIILTLCLHMYAAARTGQTTEANADARTTDIMQFPTIDATVGTNGMGTFTDYTVQYAVFAIVLIIGVVWAWRYTEIQRRLSMELIERSRALQAIQMRAATASSARDDAPKADTYDRKTAARFAKAWPHERKPRILLAEDSEVISRAIEHTLGSRFDITTIEDTAQAYEAAVRGEADMLITDVASVAIDSIKLCRDLRNNVRTALMPVIVLTERNDTATRIEASEFADAFISKPLDMGYLADHAMQLLVKHRKLAGKIEEKQALQPQADRLQSPDEKFLRSTAEIVNRHISDNEFNATALCREAGYGSKQVYRKIKQLTGMTPVEFIRDMRLQKAALYLEQNKLSVGEIMFLTGFTNASYFARCFREKYGTAPSEYARDKDKDSA